MLGTGLTGGAVRAAPTVHSYDQRDSDHYSRHQRQPLKLPNAQSLHCPEGSRRRRKETRCQHSQRTKSGALEDGQGPGQRRQGSWRLTFAG
jgi:hypothetical protein